MNGSHRKASSAGNIWTTQPACVWPNIKRRHELHTQTRPRTKKQIPRRDVFVWANVFCGKPGKYLWVRRKWWRERGPVGLSHVKFWYSDWGVISWASWSVLWNLASSNEHYRHASQGRAVVPLSRCENEWLRAIAAPSSCYKDLCYTTVCQGFSFATPSGLLCVCAWVCVCTDVSVCVIPPICVLVIEVQRKEWAASRKAVRLINWVKVGQSCTGEPAGRHTNLHV